MLLHRDPHVIEELPRTHPVELEELPELPEGVVVPDDLRGLAPPPSRPTGVRWLRWAVGLVVAAGVALAVALALTGDGETELQVQSPAAEIIQSEIDQAVAELRVEQQIRDHYEQLYVSTYPAPAYQIIQSEIDQAITELRIEQQIRSYYEHLSEAIG